MKKILCIFIASISILMAKAQVASDALRYSYIPQYGGTARALGVGGTMGSIGGDYSTISTNPAGLATFRNSELVFTPSFHTSKTKSVLENGGITSPQMLKNNFSVDNIGLVFANKPRRSDWKTINFAVGYNRFTDFNSDVFYEGSTKGSITSRWRDQLNIQNNVDKFESELALNTEVLTTKTVNGKKVYTTDFDLKPDEPVYRNQVLESRGGVGELVIALAGNYSEKVQIGVTVGVPFINYTDNRIYKEEDKNNKIPFFDNLQFDQNLTTTGAGVNAKLGLIFRPTQALRLGAAVHTPTAYRLHDVFSNKLLYAFTDSVKYRNEESSPDGEYDYTLYTPWRFIGSAGFILGKAGFINADVEYADYSQANFKLGADEVTYQNEVNTAILDRYKSALSIRVGGEAVYDIFRFRAGIGLNGSPRQDKDFTNTTYSAGLGIRGKFFFMDLGWQKRQFKENFTPYKVVDSQASTEQNVTNSYNLNDFLLTFGVKF